MKTSKQIKVLEFAQLHIQEEIAKLDTLTIKLLTVIDGYEPLLGHTGPGNTHGDNMEIRKYAKFIADQIKHILYNADMSNEERDNKRDYLYEQYFKDADIKVWKDILYGII